MKNRNHGLSEKEMELVQLLMADCESTGDIQAKLKRLFAGTIEHYIMTTGSADFLFSIINSNFAHQK